MTPVVVYMLLCDDVRIDTDNPACVHVDCLMGNIVSLETPAFPLLREMICVYLVLTECYQSGIAQIRVAYADRESEEPLFGSRQHALNFAGHSPLDLLGVVFRLEACEFPEPGRYLVQFRYNEEKVEERSLRLR
jgi:Family of unknown function (DUF6941)